MQMITCQRTYMKMRCLSIVAVVALLLSCVVSAQVSVTADGHEVNIGSGNEASNDTGDIAADVQIEGVAIINDKVYIDGVRVPKGVREVTSSKTGKTYRIVWGKDGNISVNEK